ncbi:MAG: glycine zipper domain-containing protein [Rubritepida sp.]|jgi:hypothetical protein|nr:glycine zipper domain-containing protein [Rubritepida sp.]MCU0945138.1 glycine zipper domain-containing protein [Rubritepida sp.]
MRRLALTLPILALSACGGGGLQPITITPNEERLAIGTAAGALGGLAIGSLGAEAGVGALVGAGVGLAGSAIYNHYLRHQRETYEAGYRAGRTGRPAQPPS